MIWRSKGLPSLSCHAILLVTPSCSIKGVGDHAVGFETGMAKIRKGAKGMRGLIGWTVTSVGRRKEERQLLGRVVEVCYMHPTPVCIQRHVGQPYSNPYMGMAAVACVGD